MKIRQLLTVAAYITAVSLPRFVSAQVYGALSLSGYHSGNVEARDTATPDNVLSPSISGGYKIPVSNNWSLNADLYIQPQWYTVKPDRSNIYGSIGLTAKYFFGQSSIPNTPQSGNQSPILSARAELQKCRLTAESVANRLPKSKETMATLDGLSEVMNAEGFTESMKEVILEELENMAKSLSNRKDTSRYAVLLQRLRETIVTIRSLIPEPDSLFIGAASDISSGKQGTSAALADELNPIYTLYSGTDLARKSFSHSRISVAEDTYPLWMLPLQESASLPILFDFQRNREPYTSFSYNSVTITPTVTLYPSRSLALSGGYEFTSDNYINDTSLTYREHNAWVEARTVVSSSLLVIGSAGVGHRRYPHPLRIEELVIQRPPIYVVRESQGAFTKFSFGAGLIWFIGDRLYASAIVKKTISPTVDSPTYIFEFRQGTQFAGKLSNDDFSYEKSGAVLASGCRLPGDVDIGLTIDYEKRVYPNTFTYTPARQGNPRPQITKYERTDDVTSSFLSTSRMIIPDTRVLGIFSSFEPALSISYINVNSTVNTYSYHDFNLILELNGYF